MNRARKESDNVPSTTQPQLAKHDMQASALFASSAGSAATRPLYLVAMNLDFFIIETQ